jgi:hypothetical protein
MLNFQIENFAGIMTETLASHAVDYGTLLIGYPVSIVKGIRRFV